MPIRIVPQFCARGCGRFEKLLYGCRNPSRWEKHDVVAKISMLWLMSSKGDVQRSLRMRRQDQHAQAQHWLRHAQAQIMHAQARAQAQHLIIHAQPWAQAQAQLQRKRLAAASSEAEPEPEPKPEHA